MGRKSILVGVNDVTGEVSVEAIGFKNNACLAATKPYEEAIGTPMKRTLKPEARRKAVVNRKISQGMPSGWCG